MLDRDWHLKSVPASGPGLALPLVPGCRLAPVCSIWSARWPLATYPGLAGWRQHQGDHWRVRMHALLREFRAFVETQLLGDTLEHFTTLANVDALQDWACARESHAALSPRAAYSLRLDQVGRATDHYSSYGAYDIFPAGSYRVGATVNPLAPEKITEDVSHAWLQMPPPLPPARGETHIDASKAGLIRRGARHHGTRARSSRPVRWHVSSSQISRYSVR